MFWELQKQSRVKFKKAKDFKFKEDIWKAEGCRDFLGDVSKE